MYAYEIIFCLSDNYIEKERLIITIEKVTEDEALNKLYVIFWGKSVFVYSIKKIIKG